MSAFNKFLGLFEKKKQSNVPKEKVGLYYDKMHGAAGHIYCKQCSYIVLIDVWIFDYDKMAIKTSYQCLSCGQFKNISLVKGEGILSCSCGGTLNKTHQLFCPDCKGKDLQYMCYYLT